MGEFDATWLLLRRAFWRFLPRLHKAFTILVLKDVKCGLSIPVSSPENIEKVF
jgi:hypothetical protein